MKNVVQPIKGTRDFYPEDMAQRNWLYSKVKEVSTLYGYQEYEGPLLEPLELYAAKSGEELVNEQSFVFSDRSGDLITLRPELTPTLARMVAQHQKQLIYPLRWWSYGPFWRYERPQKGRSREFFQWNIDLIGANTSEADAEMIAIIATFFRLTGLPATKVRILINDRSLAESELANMHIPRELYSAVFKLIDRKDKISLNDWSTYASELGLSPKNIDDLLKMLNNKTLWQKSQNLTNLFNALDALDVHQYTEYDPGIIRGLDYYTSTVFEAKETEGDIRRSILGGGRYDNLLADGGGDTLPAVGFAMGDVVITLILKSQNCIPDNIGKLSTQVCVTVFDQQHFYASLKFTSQLRQAGINTICYPDPENLGKQFKYASRMGIKLVIIIGPDEIKQGTISIKELSSAEQKTIPHSDAIALITTLLENEHS
jgi:histidyl-tRNA synthetase